MEFFTSDTHFGHKNIIRFCNRPFDNCHQMDEEMIKRWNEKVSKNDHVYHLGDFGLAPWHYLEDILTRLNGKITILEGSHDRALRKHIDLFKILTIKIGKNDITLCHYSMRSWPRSHYGSFHIFGHSHGKLAPYGKSFDVGVDSNDFYPWSLDEVVEKMCFLGYIMKGEKT